MLREQVARSASTTRPVTGQDRRPPARTNGRPGLQQRCAVAATATVCLSTVVAGCATTASSPHAPGPPADPITPASTPTAATTTTTAGAPSPSVPETTGSSSSGPQMGQALLPLALLPRPVGFGPWSRRTMGHGPALIGGARCALSAAAVTDVAHQRRDYVGPAGQAAAEVTAAFDSVTAAEQAWSMLQRQTRRCSTGSPQVAHLPKVGDATAVLLAQTQEPSPQAPDALGVGLVRTGRLVSLLVVQVPARTPPTVAAFAPLLQAVARHSAPFGR